MAMRQTPEQEIRISDLLDAIAREHGQEVIGAVKSEIEALPTESAVLLLELVTQGAWGTDARAVQVLVTLGYEEAGQVLAVSRLLGNGRHKMTVPTIVSLALPWDRAEALLEATPGGVVLFSPADDKPWRRALLGLPIEALGRLVAEAGSSVELWTSIVSAHDPAMRRRIERFVEAGFPYVPWMASIHDLAELSAAVPDGREGERLTRFEVNEALRFLDGGGVAR